MTDDVRVLAVVTPGVYTHLSNDEYHAAPGISRTGIMELQRSPHHFWDRYLNPDRPPEKKTKSLELGSALHTLILEPEKFFQTYIIDNVAYEKVEKMPLLRDVGREAYDLAKKNNEAAKKINEELEAEFLKNADDKIIIKQEVYQTILAMKNSLINNPETAGFLTGAKYEHSIFWVDEDTGVLCKCRPDIWHANMFCDLKNTRNASPYGIQSDIDEYGYHIQAAMIIDAAKAIEGKDYKEFILIPVENTRPFASTSYLMDRQAIEKGREEYKKELINYKKCRENNEWPSYRPKVVSLPRYRFYL